MANSVDPDQMLLQLLLQSDVGLHCSARLVCTNILDRYRMYTEADQTAQMSWLICTFTVPIWPNRFHINVWNLSSCGLSKIKLSTGLELVVIFELELWSMTKPTKNSDQPAHPPSLISLHHPPEEGLGPKLSIITQWRFAIRRARDLSLRWAHGSFCGICPAPAYFIFHNYCIKPVQHAINSNVLTSTNPCFNKAFHVLL